MELTNIIILTLSIAAASSTPHGYGTKGGAFAKSSALAGAGTYQDYGVPAGAGSSSYSSSGSFAKSSASSFASASSGSFSFGGSGGYGGFGGGSSDRAGVLKAPESTDSSGVKGGGGVGDGGSSLPGAGGAVVAGANANAFASALAGINGGHGFGSPVAPCTGNCPSPDQEKPQQPAESNGGHGFGFPVAPCTGNCPTYDQEKPQQPADSIGGHGFGSPAAPCTKNCPSSDQEKPQQPSCGGTSCESSHSASKCTSGSCEASTSGGLPHSQSFGQSPSEAPTPPISGLSVDSDDRPGKVSEPGTKDTPSHENNKDHPHSAESEAPGYQLCSSPGCINNVPIGVNRCTSPDCGQTIPSRPEHCTSPGCGKISSDKGVGAFSNSNSEANANAGTSGYGNSPQINPGFSRTPILNKKPIFDLSEDKPKEALYGGGFGGPPGILKPNDYSVVPKPVHSSDSAAVSGHNGLQGLPHQIPQGVPSQPSIYQQPPTIQNPIYPSHGTIPSGSYVPPVHGQKPGGGHYGGPGFAGSGTFAGAAAGASASAYTGSFGGPPGILKPNDFNFHGVKPGGFTRPHGDKVSSVGTHPVEQSQGNTPSNNDETSYHGGFGGAPGVIRPNGPLGTGTFPSRQPQDKPQVGVPQETFSGKPGIGCNTGLGPGCSGVYPTGLVQVQSKPESGVYVDSVKPSQNCGPGTVCAKEETYHGGFGGAPGIIRPTGTVGHEETYPVIHPMVSIQAQSEPESTGTVHPTKPSANCSPGSICEGKETYHGGFGGVPGIIRPTGTTGPKETYHGIHEGKPEGSYAHHSNYNSGHTDGTKYPTQFGGAPDSGSFTVNGNGRPTGTGDFSGATASATAGAISGQVSPVAVGQQEGYGGNYEGYGGQQGGYGGQQGGYSGHPGGYGSHPGGYGGHPGGFSYHQGGLGGQGAYGGTKSSGSIKGCNSGCGGSKSVKGGNGIGSYGAGGGDGAGQNDFSTGGLNGALAGAKSAAGSFSLAGAGAGAGAGGLAGAGAAAVAGAGAGAGGSGGHYGQGGSFASAQASASASAKSYGGYH